MSAIVDTLRQASGRPSDVVERVAGLERAVDAARGRLDDTLVAEATAVVERAAGRLRLSSEHTVVAIAGSTGSGKSSLFNELVGLDLAATGVRRPTTSWTLACAWGPEGATELLDWLGIPKRHQINRTGMLDDSAADHDLDGLVLLDLPDHDSTEVSHHLEVERLVTLADVLIWVLDPQKYADAAVHDRFLKRLSSHAEVMMVVLNHIDELPPGGLEPTMKDVGRLLELDGLEGVPVFATSATEGDGMTQLRKALVERVATKKDAKERLRADVRAVASRVAEQTGSAKPADVRQSVRGELLDACADAAGVPVVVSAIESATRIRARRATGWPVTKWLARLRPDPLKRLRLDTNRPIDVSDLEALRVSRSSLPQATPVQHARVDTSVRQVADELTHGMSRPWSAAIRSASVSRVDDLTDALDVAVARTDLGVAKDPWWWSGVRVLQWVLFVAAVIGGGWLAALAFFSYLQLPEPGTAEWGGVAVPTVLFLGGVLLGLVVAGLSRLAARWSAHRRARRAEASLHAAIATVVDDLVVDPMQRELDAYAQCRDGIEAALRR
jgi:GTP-binding protein EngB required for normal cell division